MVLNVRWDYRFFGGLARLWVKNLKTPLDIENPHDSAEFRALFTKMQGKPT
jgi:hypothetical protein